MKHQSLAANSFFLCIWTELNNGFPFEKRPLGDIETRHRYTPTQPVLSCRTVDIDVSGTRTYRPKSSADIINEQHALIHRIYSKNKTRNIASAPPRRPKTPRVSVETKNKDNTVTNNKKNNLKSVEVQGRPLTSVSQRQRTHSSIQLSTSNKRPKTTGNIKSTKSSHENFMIVHSDRELLETRRSYQSLTNKIHQHWEPENHDLNTGTYQRGKKPPGIPSVDSWLTFSGSQANESNGVVDAFAEHVLEQFLEDSDDSSVDEMKDLDAQGEYYNVEGTVGSRIAQQLQKGDRIRIGINGNVQTHDLKVKKWCKEESPVKPPEDVENGEGKENMARNENQIIPLSWEDQVQASNTKIITPRQQGTEKTRASASDTHPVTFTKLLPDESSSISIKLGKPDTKFKVKQRKKNKPGVDGRQQENKVTVVTIDSRSEEEEKAIESLTVDEVIKQNVSSRISEKQNGHTEEGERLSVTFALADLDPHNTQDALYNAGKNSIADSHSSVMSDYKHPKVKPSQPTFSSKTREVDLDIIGTLNVPNGQRPLSSETEQPMFTKAPFMPRPSIGRAGSARSTHSGMKSAKSLTQRSLVSNSLINMSSPSYRQNEAEFIQISHPVKNPNTGPQKKQSSEFMPLDSSRSIRTASGIRDPMPSPELTNYDDTPIITNEPTVPIVPIKPAIKVVTPALSINIPTADYTDSAMSSPTRKQTGSPESSPLMRRANDMRDEQIEQITTLLVDAIIGPNGRPES
ncbi:uncharacterized protein LOC127861481 isoform X2 [Dreissena polymorpha]|uniref:uncharacterized protein LOC127861481 isoform X2 n=1 Tax=Dreissena polymorpha TaxID=45954 RepID=UPI002263AF9F|nr:uncharacterized protein LOC127861481 isoform X2 [Dreissena polymorpha]